MSVAIIGNSGTVAEVDEARNQQVFQTIAGFPASAGGFYTVAGKSAAGSDAAGVIAASLAASTALMGARFAAGSTRKAYITKLRVLMGVCTAGAAGGIASTIGFQRFTTAAMSGGNARVSCRLGPTKGSATDMTDIRDFNAALTVTSVVFGDIISSSLVSNGSTNVSQVEWIFEPMTPVELAAGDGVCLRTMQAGPATATWQFSWSMHWFER